MPKCRDAFADALSRLLFDKPLAELDRSERAELNFLRALEADAADEAHYQQLADAPAQPDSERTLH
jgi:hypothetical protein